MIVDLRAHSRRKLLMSAGFAGLFGWTLGVSATRLAQGTWPSLSVLGEDAWQLVLIDAERVRILVVVNAPPDDVVERTRRLLGVFRLRIDVLVADEQYRPDLEDKLRDRWAIERVVGIGAGVTISGPPQITEPELVLDLDGGIKVAIRPVLRDEWRSEDLIPGTDWTIGVRRKDQAVLLANRLESALLADVADSAVVIAPGGSLMQVEPILGVSCVAVNASEVASGVGISEGSEGTQLVRIFPDDVARFVFADDGIEIPEWQVPLTAE